MAKAKVTVTRTDEFEIEIKDEHLTPENLAQFARCGWDVSKPEDVFKCAAFGILEEGSPARLFTIEGLGLAIWAGHSNPEHVAAAQIKFTELYDDSDAVVEPCDEEVQL